MGQLLLDVCCSRLKMLKLIVIFAAISAVCFECIHAAPAQHSNAATCKRGCPSTNKGNKLNYLPGQQYAYSFESSVAVRLTGKDAQEVTLKVQGQALVSGLSECQYGLELRDVTVFGPDNKRNKLQDNLQLTKLVRFTLSDDTLEPEICVDKDDKPFSLNVKRAIISLLQSRQSESVETDVFGTCPTSFSVTTGPDGDQIVTKIRDLNVCSHREVLVNGLVAGVFNENSGIKSTPLLNGDYTNEQHINKNGIIESSQVTEQYSLVPFTNGEAGAKAHVITKLQLKETKAGAPKSVESATVPRSLLFEVADKPIVGDLRTASNALKNVVDTYQNNVGPKAAGQFIELIRVLRYVKQQDLLTILANINASKNKDLSVKIYLDALFRVGTADSVAAIATLLKNNKISGDAAKQLAYLSFNAATSVNKDALDAVQKLLDTNLPKEAYLSIGNLIRKYCQKNTCQRGSLKELYSKLLSKLKSCKDTDSKVAKREVKRSQEDQTVAVLKGIRNSKFLLDIVAERLISCSTNAHSTRVRVASIQAYSAGVCEKKIQTSALSLLQNREEDAEIRIEAYLILAECPNAQIAKELQTLLNDEPSYQVGSFISTHLASLRASTDSHRSEARKQLADVQTSKKFPHDIRQYSFNHELSYALDSLGVGASADSSVIYSKRSFLPVSVRANLTGELFGTNFNILEVNGRQENLDLLLERYFGPKGVHNTLKDGGIIESLVKSLHGKEDGKRHHRSLRDDAEQFVKQTQPEHDDRDLDIDLSVRLFGSDLFFLSLNNSLPVDGKGFERVLRHWWEKFLANAKDGKKIDLERHALFLDTDIVYPTSIGFPLKIQTHGAAVVRLQTELQADIKDILKNPKNTQFLVKVVPSYNVELSGSMIVDGYAVATGLKVSSYVHSSTGAALTFKLLDQGKGVDVNLAFPQKKQEIISFDHKVVFITQELGRESVATNLKSQKREASEMCFDQLNPYIGATLCFQYSSSWTNKDSNLVNAPALPLNGPNHAAAWINIDTSYNFRVNYDDKTDNHRSLQLIFNTPDSQPSRKTSITLEGEISPKVYARVQLDSPVRSAAAEVGFSDDNTELSVYAKANNGKDSYLAKGGFKKSGPAQLQEYTPIIEVTKSDGSPSSLRYRVSGKVIVDKTQGTKIKYKFDNLLIEPLDPSAIGPLRLNGHFEHDRFKEFDLSLDIKHKEQSGKIDGTLKVLDRGIDLDVGLVSNVGEYLNGKIILKLDSLLTDTTAKAQRSLTVIYGKDLESKTKRVEVAYDYEFLKDAEKKLQSGAFNSKVNVPFLPLKLVLNGSLKNKQVTYDLLAEYVTSKVASKLNGGCSQKVKGDWNIDWSGQLNKHTLNVKSDRVINEAAHKSAITNKITTSGGQSIDLNADIGHEFSLDKADVSVDGQLVLERGQAPYKLDFVLVISPKLAKTNGHLLSGTTKLVTLDVVANRNGGDINNPTKITLEVAVKDLLTASGAYNSQKGVGEGSVLIALTRLDRKLKAVTKYTRGTNQLNVNYEVFLNFEKDNENRIVVDTQNKYEDRSLDSKNKLTLFTQNYELNFDIKRTGDQTKRGTMNGNFLLRLPTDREISGKLTRNVDLDGPKATGTGNIKLIDTVKAGGQKSRSIELDVVLRDGNVKERYIDILHTLTVTDFDGKNVIVEHTAKHMPVGHFTTASTSLLVKGSKVPNTLDLLISADEYCAVHAKYRAALKHGDIHINLNGDYAIGERGVKPSTYKIKGVAAIPQTKVKQLAFESSGSIKQPAVNDQNGKYEYDLKLKGNLNNQELSFATNGETNERTGKSSLNIHLPETEPLSIDVNYNHNGLWLSSNDENAIQTAQGGVTVNYGNGKVIQFNGDVKLTPERQAVIKANVRTPYEQAKSLELYINAEKKGDNEYSNVIELTVDGKKWKIEESVILSKHSPSLVVNVLYPPNQQSEVSFVINRVSDRKHKGSLRILNVNGFSLTGDAEVNFQNIENFSLLVDVDSAALKANKVHVEVLTKQNGGVKSVEFRASEASKNIVSGQADYTVKEERGKTTVDGKGSVNWYDKAGVANFQFVKNDMEESRDNETGVMLLLNGELGPKRINAEIKLTNKNFHIRHTICENKEPCINFDIDSTISNADLNGFKHNLLVAVDLRKLGFAHEFNLKSETTRVGWTLLHNLDMHLKASDNKIYSYQFYVKPSSTGVVLDIPSRTAAIEAVYEYPKELIGQYKVSISSWLNKKREPNKRSSIAVAGEVKRVGKSSFKTTAELVLSHPQTKDLKVKGNAELDAENKKLTFALLLDVFRHTNDAITLDYVLEDTDKSFQNGFNARTLLQLQSKGLGLNYKVSHGANANWELRTYGYTSEVIAPSSDERFGIYIKGTAQRLEFSLAAFNEDLIRANAQLDLNKRTFAVEASTKLLGTEPIVSHAKLTALSAASASITQGKFLKINADLTAGKEISLKIVGNEKQLLKAQIALGQSNLLTTEYDINENEFKEFLNAAKAKVSSDSKLAKEETSKRFTKLKQTVTKQVNHVKEALPDLDRVGADFKQEIQNLNDELLSDKAIKDLVDFYQKTFAPLNKAIAEILKTLTEQYQKTIKVLTDAYKQLYDGFNERVLPQLKESFKGIELIIRNLYDETINLGLTLFEKLVQQLKSLEPEIKRLGKITNEWAKQISEVANKLFDQIRQEINEIYQLVIDGLKSLPGFDALKEKVSELYKSLVVPDAIVGVLNNIADTLKDTLQVPDLNELLKSIISYIEKKLKNEQVNDTEAIKVIWTNLLKTIKSLINLIPYGGFAESSGANALWGLPIPGSLQQLSALPQFSTLQLSIWNYWRHERIPSLSELIYAYRPQGFNPLNALPPFDKQGHIIDGSHLFTFDGQQLSLPGNCRYVVAQDVVDGNFTVVAQIAANKLTSISLVDKSGDSVEITNQGAVLLNDKASDLPVHENSIHAWRTYYSVQLLSSYGVRVHCKLDLKTCHVTVDGYYHNKLRGLLGNGNAERYDDLQLPNSHLSSTLTGFVNAFKLEKSCADVTIDEQHKHEKDDAQSEECDSVLGGSSSLRYCNIFIDVKPYKSACQHAVKSAANKQEAACSIAFGYASFCRNENIPVSLPDVCAQCQAVDESGKPVSRAIGDTYTVKAPQKKADVIIVVDTEIEPAVLNDLVSTTISDLRRELKARDINDVLVNVIGFKKGDKYVSHYTISGHSNIQKFHLPTSKDENIPKEERISKVGCEHTDAFLEKLEKLRIALLNDFALAADGRAFREAVSAPFRSSASKVVIAIRSDVLTHSSNPLKLIGARAANALTKHIGVNLHLISPIEELAIDTLKDTKNVVGFNSKRVLQLSDNRKRTNIGSTELRSHLTYGEDLGIDMTQGENEGYAFSLTNYQKLEAQKRKTFLAVATAAIADQIARTEFENDCRCRLHHGLFPIEWCKVSDSKAVAPVVKKPNRG